MKYEQVRFNGIQAHWCLEAAFASLNEVEVFGPVSFLYVSDIGLTVRGTVDGAWYGPNYKWNSDIQSWM